VPEMQGSTTCEEGEGMSEDEGMTDRECWCKLYGWELVQFVPHYDIAHKYPEKIGEYINTALTYYYNSLPLWEMCKKEKV
jgi:hypothetical protein